MRPVPLEYSLDTHFQVTNNEEDFLSNPFTRNLKFGDVKFDPGLKFAQGRLC